MRLLIAALVFTLAIAVTASVFAIWPAVADAPWEESAAPVVAPPRQPRELSPCEVLRQQVTDAQTDAAVQLLYGQGRLQGCW